jgi:predicted transcriptional regulator
MAIGEICNREVIIADRSLAIDEAARLMRSHHVGHLIIVEKMGCAIGLSGS